MMLSDVCPTSVCLTSVAYIGPKSRTERPRKTKICTEVAHVTRDSDTTFKIKRSKVKVTRRLYSPRVYTSGCSCSGERGKVYSPWEPNCYVAVCRRGGRLGGARRFGAHRGRRGAGAYRGGCPPTACSTLSHIIIALQIRECLRQRV